MLGVKNILEGAVQRVGNQVRITMQLIEAETDNHLWANTYDRELTANNIFEIQSEIAKAIATVLKATLTTKDKQLLALTPTDNLEALEKYYLGHQGVKQRNAKSLKEAEKFLKQALELDPDYPMALVELTITYFLQTFYEARSQEQALELGLPLINRAIKLTPQLGEAYVVKGYMYVTESAEKERIIEKGLVLSPGYAEGHYWYGVYLENKNRVQESIREMKIAMKLDPMSSIVRVGLGYMLSVSGRLEEALQQYQTIVKTEPDFAHTYFAIGQIDLYGYGRADRAIENMHQAIKINPESGWYIAELANMWGNTLGESDIAEQLFLKAFHLAPKQMRVLEFYLTPARDKKYIN